MSVLDMEAEDNTVPVYYTTKEFGVECSSATQLHVFLVFCPTIPLMPVFFPSPLPITQQ